MDYKQANEELQGRCFNSRKLGNNTYLVRLDNCISLKYHDTHIIKMYPDKLVIDCNGFRTKTTKERLNEYTPIRVNQTSHVWYINGKQPYFDGIELDYKGTVLNADNGPKVAALKTTDELKNKIHQYVNGFISHIKTNGVPMPSGGDCWFCAFKTDDNRSMGDISNDNSHLLSHIDEKYYFGSILYNALTESGYNAGLYISMGLKFGESTYKRSLRKYLIKRLIK